jgi:hypothetical protein
VVFHGELRTNTQLAGKCEQGIGRSPGTLGGC